MALRVQSSVCADMHKEDFKVSNSGEMLLPYLAICGYDFYWWNWSQSSLEVDFYHAL